MSGKRNRKPSAKKVESMLTDGMAIDTTGDDEAIAMALSSVDDEGDEAPKAKSRGRPKGKKGAAKKVRSDS